MTKIAASILSADFANLQQDCTRLLEEGVDVLHIDVMDGHFVPNISYGAPVLSCLHAALPDVYYDVHLMISDPARYAADFEKAGAGLITFHLEAVPDTAEEVIAAIRATGCQVGISIRPGTPVEAAFPYLGVVDLILVMSVEPGFGGQKFLPGTPQHWMPSASAAAAPPCWKWTAASMPKPAPCVYRPGPTGWLPAILSSAPRTRRRWYACFTAKPERTKGEAKPHAQSYEN